MWLEAASRNPRPADVVLAGTRPPVTYAPQAAQQLSLTWGPNGLVLIQGGEGNDPASWNTYIGTLHSNRLSRLSPYVTNGITFNPAGNVIAGQNDSGEVVFLPTPRPACERTRACLSFQAQFLTGQGNLQAWVR